MSAAEPRRARGAPLIMIAVVLAAWTGGRALTWENPFPAELPAAIDPAAMFAYGATPATGGTVNALSHKIAGQSAHSAITPGSPSNELEAPARLLRLASLADDAASTRNASDAARVDPAIALAHNLLWLQSLGAKFPPGDPRGPALAAFEAPLLDEGYSPTTPIEEPAPARGDRWSFDMWGFWREGSDATAISQGRVPIYGASQVGARLAYRLAPSSRRDPQAYLRGYRALVRHGENEGAIGVSARPVGAIPVRLAAEMRLTNTRFGTDPRPAILAHTELPPQDLPARFRLEAYGGAGYVGGKGSTAFVDGQASITRELVELGGPGENRARLSLGAGAWAGAQRDAHRVDLGPTMRIDLTVGRVPARLSVDWRERVGGDAAPDSGLAATLSTRF